MNGRLALAFAPALALSACSGNTAYESMQGSARQACHALPDARDQLECLRQRDLSYEQYRKQREPLSAETARPASN